MGPGEEFPKASKLCTQVRAAWNLRCVYGWCVGLS
jgi:hypothetical protein